MLFKSPLFTGCRSNDKLHLPGNHQLKDHHRWIPLVMLWSGARPGEIAQMNTADVKQIHGTWTLHITDLDDDEKRVKTRGSVRIVPVHSELVRLGFVDFVERQRKKGEKRLFPEAERNQRGQIAAKFSGDFGRYLQRLKMKSGGGLSLYSLRHGFIDALRQAEYLDEAFGFLLGHLRPTMTAQYGTPPQGMLRQRVEMV